MRSDARRNRDSVLEAGARVLADRPHASMQEIADASGVGRTTVYRHFPAREELVAALVTQVVEEIHKVNADALSGNRPAADVLRKLSADIAVLGRRWSFLRSQREAVVAQAGESDRAFLDWVVTAQRRGELRDDLPPDWVRAVARAVITAGVDEADRIGAEEAGRLAGETLVSALVR